MFRRASKGAGARIESLEDFTAKFGLNNTLSTKSAAADCQKREGNNNVKREDLVKRRGKGLERESSVERRKSSIQ